LPILPLQNGYISDALAPEASRRQTAVPAQADGHALSDSNRKPSMTLPALLTCLALLTVAFGVCFVVKAQRHSPRLSPEALLMGFVANFFDTLGIGSFAPTTAYMKFRGIVSDELIPPTLIAGYAVPTAVEAFVFITSVRIDSCLLVVCILMSILGALIGASFAARLPVRQIRLLMGAGLLIAAALFALANLGEMPAGGAATSLGAASFAVAALATFVLGLLVNVGIGIYGPLLITFSLLGLDPRAAFPVMMGSAAFQMLADGIKLLSSRPLNPTLLVSMAAGAVPGVLIAAFLVRSLPLQPLRWGVVIVVSYAALCMLFSATRTAVALPTKEPG
jgi:uncharacterized membrane protein YfcA